MIQYITNKKMHILQAKKWYMETKNLTCLKKVNTLLGWCSWLFCLCSQFIDCFTTSFIIFL